MAILTNALPEVTATNTVTLTNKTLTSPVLSDPTITGTITNINTTNLEVADKNIIINDIASPTDSNADGGGISLNGDTTKSLNWVNSTDAWTSSENMDLAAGKVYKINGTNVLTATAIFGKTLGGSSTGDIVTIDDSQTLTNKTLISPVISSISNTGTLTLPTSTDTLVGRDTSDTLTNKTLTAPTINDALANYATFKAPSETANVVASAATGTINIDAETSTIWYYTSNASANHTLNFRFNSSTSLSSKLSVGEAITFVWMNTNGATPYYPSTIQVDGSSVTPKFQNGTSFAAGNASAVDIYSFTIVKTDATPTYVVLASQTKFA